MRRLPVLAGMRISKKEAIENMREQIGAIWNRNRADGKPYLSGEVTIDGKKIMWLAFQNDRKSKKEHPDWRIVLKDPNWKAKRETGYIPEEEPPFPEDIPGGTEDFEEERGEERNDDEDSLF
jgi:uncharacterized protein (DUF736 family)